MGILKLLIIYGSWPAILEGQKKREKLERA
jgi:hypothetical protein